MKHWILKTIIALMILIPVGVFAGDCQNPLGKTYQYNEITVHFVDGYQQDTIAQILIPNEQPVFLPYTWDSKICMATILSDPPIYLEFDETWFDIRENPYRFSVVLSGD